MSAKPGIAAAALLLLTAQAPPPAGPPAAPFARACAAKDGWSDPAPPVRVFANIYHVGTCGIVVLLVTSDQGHVLLDTGPADAVTQIIANVRALGLKPEDIAWIVTSHEHSDHVGGLAELKRLTGARLAARAAAKGPLERGTPDWRDPQVGSLQPFTGASVDRVLADGEHVIVGSLDLTAHATPGHAPGSTSWSWRACEGQRCHDVVYADSVTAVAAESYQFSRQAVYLDAFARSLGRIAALPCDLLITPHPAQSQLHERMAGTRPLADPDACLNYALAGQAALEARLQQEQVRR